MKRRVVITGIGIVSPLGNSLEKMWDNVKNGVCAIDNITKFNIENFPISLAAEVTDFDLKDYISRKEARRMDLFCQYAVVSAMDAWKDAKLESFNSEGANAGVIIGSGIGGLSTIEEQAIKMYEKGPERVSPFFIPMSIINMAPGYVAIALGLKGHSLSMQTACASGSSAIGEAANLISQGKSDIMVAGGVEAAITPLAVAGFASMKALYDGTDKNRASIPFDKERSGFVIGEGAATVILESLESAKEREAKIYGEVVGYGATSDAYHITAPAPDGKGASQAMINAIIDAGISHEDIGYINAHGTSTPLNDKIETLAIKNVFKDVKVPVSSTKSMTGHLLGAAGALEAVISVMALKEGVLPPTANYETRDPDCDLDYIVEGARKSDAIYALSNSFGFGGHNVVLALKKWDDINE